MADEEHRVVYRAVADFSNLAVEAAKAKAEIDSLGNTQARASQKAAESERALTSVKRDSAKAEQELSQASSRHLQDAAKLDQANKSQAASNQQLWLATRKQVEELSKAAKAQQDYISLLRAGRGVMTEGSGRLEAPGRATREGEALGQQGIFPRQQARDASQSTRSQRQQFLEEAERVHQEMLDRNAQRRQPSYQRGLQEVTPREPSGVWNDQALFDALTSSEGKLIEASKTAEGALGRQRKTTRDKGGDVRALAGELDRLTDAEARVTKATRTSSEAGTHHKEVMQQLQRAAAASRADAARSTARAAESREHTARAGAETATARSLISEQDMHTAVTRGDTASLRRDQAAASALTSEINMEAAAHRRNTARLREDVAAGAALVAEQNVEAAALRRAAAGHNEESAATRVRISAVNESIAGLREATAGHNVVGAAARADASQERARGAFASADTAEERLEQARNRTTQSSISLAKAEEMLRQTYVRGEAQSKRASEQAAKAEQKRREDLGPLGLLGEAFQASARLGRDAVQRRRLGRPGTRRGLALAREDVEPAPAAGAGGGGGGAIFGNILGGFSEFADSVSSGLVKMIPKLINWRTLVIAAIAAAGPLVALLGSLGAVAIGAGNGLISLAGSAAALPGLFAAGATAIGALAIAIAPLVGVFKAYEQQQKLATAGTAQMAETMREANMKVAQAQHSYLDASQGIVEAQYSEQRAQVSLNEARKQAARDLQDLREQLMRTGLNEENAQLALRQAIADYNKTLADGNSTQLEREESLNRVKNAQFDLNETLIKNKRTTEDAALAEKKGVEGSDQVVEARHAVAQATKGLSDASYQLKTAVQNLAQAQKEQAAGGAAMLQANNALAGALENLSPKTRTVVEHFLGMGGAFKNLQRQLGEDIFGPLIGDLGNIDSFMPIVNGLLGSAATALGQVLQSGVELVTAPNSPWRKDFGDLATNNAKLITTFGDAGFHVADAFRNIVMAAAPFTQWVADAVKKVAGEFDKWAASARASGGIADFLKTTEDRLTQVGTIISNLFSVFKSLFFASSDFTGSMFDGIVKVSQGWADWAKKQEGHGSAFKKWLEDVKPLLGQVWTFIVEVAQAFGHLAANPDNINEAKNILKELGEDILPKLVAIFDSLSQSNAISKVLHDLGIFLGLIADAVGSGKGSGVFKLLVDGAIAFGAAMAALTAVTLIAKFSGLLALFKGIASTWGFFLSNKGKLGQAFKDLATDITFGRGSGGTAQRRIDSKNPVDEGGVRERGTYTGQLTRLIAQLDEKIELEIEMNGLLKSILGAVEKIGVTEPRAPRPTSSVESGAGAEGGAASRLDGAASALDGAAGRLDVAAEQLISAARSLRTSSLLNDLPGGGATRAAEKDAAKLAEKEAVQLAEKDAGKAGPSLLRRMFSWLPGVSKTAPEAGAVAKEGLSLGKLFKGGLALDPLTWAGIGLSAGSDAGLFGGRGSAGKQFGQSGGAIALGASLGVPLGPVGIAAGAIAGGGYSLYKDKGLRERLASTPGLDLFSPTLAASKVLSPKSKDPLGDAGHDFMTGLHALGDAKFWDSIGQHAAEAWGSVKKAFEQHVSGPVAGFFTKTLPGVFSGIGEQAVAGFGAVKSFFTSTLPSLPGKALTALRHIDWEELGVKVGASLRRAFIFFERDLPGKIAHGLESIGKELDRHVAKPVEKFVTKDIPHFFTVSIPRWFDTVTHWWMLHVIVPVTTFITQTIPNFFTRTIPRWFETAIVWWRMHVMLPIGAFIRGIPDFFLKTIPHWFESVGAWWRLHVMAPVGEFIRAVPDFFLKTIPHWFEAAPRWWNAHVTQPVVDFITKSVPSFFTQTIPHWFEGVWSWFMSQVVHPVEDWLTHLPGKIWDAIKSSAPAQFIKGLYEGITGQKKQSGGLVAGTYQGRDDTEPHLLSIDEYVMRRDISQQPHGKRMLDDINNKRVSAADFYAALDRNTRPSVRPVAVAVGAVASPASASHTVSTRNAGMSVGDITINNPVREKSTTSMRRQLHSLAHLGRIRGGY